MGGTAELWQRGCDVLLPSLTKLTRREIFNWRHYRESRIRSVLILLGYFWPPLGQDSGDTVDYRCDSNSPGQSTVESQADVNLANISVFLCIVCAVQGNTNDTEAFSSIYRVKIINHKLISILRPL
mmetsp:Transcript_6717/g.20456  ORF Transcript_6717/g.20456 Transcript_6717/m.20456 type:complete len:126 (-) Transcript_6717:2961-3338(-)